MVEVYPSRPRNEFARAILSSLINGKFTEYFEQAPGVFRVPGSLVQEFFTLDALDKCLDAGLTTGDDVQVWEDGRQVPPHIVSRATHRELVDPDLLLMRFSKGASIVVNSIHERCRTVAAVTSALEGNLLVRAQANAYLSPVDSRCFGLHADNHCVLVIQVVGAKAWEVYAPESVLPRPDSDGLLTPPPGSGPALTTTLDVGDVLYIPRGWPHMAKTAGSDSSLHMTIGLFPVLRDELLSAFVETASEEVDFLRQSFPLSTTTPEEVLGWFATIAGDGRATQWAQLTLDRAMSNVLRSFRVPRASRLATEDSRAGGHAFRLREGLVVKLEERADALELEFLRRRVSLPIEAKSAVRWILQQRGDFEASELSGFLPPPAADQLVACLLDEGMLEEPRPL